MTTFDIPLQSIQSKEYLWPIYQTTDASIPHQQRVAEVKDIVLNRANMWNQENLHPIHLSSPREWLDILDEVEAVNNLYRHIIISLGNKTIEDFNSFALFSKRIVLKRRLSSLDLLKYISKHPSLITTSLLFPSPESYKIYKLPKWN